MKDELKTVFGNGTGEITVKKSRFIATICPVDSEAAANEIIENLKKKYWDAAHNCSAYIIDADSPLMRCLDDGEPSRTAGRPMLDILTAWELTNIVAVVTRYFGGTLLGTGGLVKAYQSAVLEGLNNSKIITKQLGTRLKITTDYSMIGKIQHLAAAENVTFLSSEYTDIAELSLLIPVKKVDFLTKKITELTNGSVIMEKTGLVYFTTIDGEVYLF